MTEPFTPESTPNPQVDLATAAQAVDVGDATRMLAQVHTTASKRRRRRSALGGLAAVGTLAVSGAVIANVVGGDDGGDLIVSSPVAESEVGDEAPAEEALEPVAPATTALPVLDATAPPSNILAAVPDGAGGVVVSDPAFQERFGNVRLLAWNDGFLAVHQSSQPQALPTEIPEEISTQFSQEAKDFFADGLPATIDEAITQLEEAGLYEEVRAVVLANPTVFEAVYSVPTAQVVDFRFSPDGVEWEDIDVVLPDPNAQFWNMMSTGSRLALLSDPNASGAGGVVTETPMQMFSTTDLVNWTTQEINQPPRPADLPEFVDFQVYAEPLVGNDQFWAVTVNSYVNVDPISLLDPDTRDQIQSSSRGYGTSIDDLGVTINVEQEDGTSENLQFSWEELGVESPGTLNGDGQRISYVGAWDGGPAVQTLDDPNGYREQPVTIVGGLARSDPDGQISISSDGKTWEQFNAPFDGYSEALLAYGDSVVAFGVDGEERAIAALDLSTGDWLPMTIEGLPENFSASTRGSGIVTLYEYDGFENGGRLTAVGSRSSGEVDGYRLELNVTFDNSSATGTYTLTRLETGEVVSTETTDALYESVNFEFASEDYDIDGGEGGFRFFDPETGEELVSIPFSVMENITIGADGEEIVFDPNEEPMQLAEWLLATDGTNWVIDQINEGGSTEEGLVGFGDAVVANGFVLVSMYDGTFVRYELG
ncbi:MAG: hypothetical protein ACI8V4_000594 [Ilumatobacter sp.]|jgi:hypothetical protein